MEKSGISLSTLLTIVFVILKLTGTIDWSWWWVFSPMWITWSLILIVAIFLVTLPSIFK